MSDPSPRIRRGAHRPRRDPLRGLLTLLVVLAALALVLTGVALWRPGGTANTALQSPDPAPMSDELAAVRRSNTPGAPSSRSTPAKAPLAPAASPRPSRTASPPLRIATPSAAPPASATARPTSPAARLPVVVLNAGGRAGLAARTAARLERRGWRVEGAANFRGSLSGTTVYYPSGYADAAQALAADLTGSARVRQLSAEVSGLSSRRLTVVLTSDYPG